MFLWKIMKNRKKNIELKDHSLSSNLKLTKFWKLYNRGRYNNIGLRYFFMFFNVKHRSANSCRRINYYNFLPCSHMSFFSVTLQSLQSPNVYLSTKSTNTSYCLKYICSHDSRSFPIKIKSCTSELVFKLFKWIVRTN